MNRRDNILSISAMALAPLVATAQSTSKIPRIGWMSGGNSSTTEPNLDRFLLGMQELGYIAGKTFTVEPRYADGKNDLMAEQAAELEQLGVEVIVAGPYAALQAARQSTTHVPIVMTTAVDPILTGAVKSYARPDGNVTGITEMLPELTPRRLEILRQIAPELRKVGILWQPGTLSEKLVNNTVAETQAIATTFGIEVRAFGAKSLDDLEEFLKTISQTGIDGLIVLVNPMFLLYRQRIAERTAKYRIAAIFEWSPFVQSGGLVSYGANVPDVYRRAAGYVDKILKGSKPGDLPVTGPVKIDLAVNLKTAAALGLTVPIALIEQASLIVKAD